MVGTGVRWAAWKRHDLVRLRWAVDRSFRRLIRRAGRSCAGSVPDDLAGVVAASRVPTFLLAPSTHE